MSSNCRVFSRISWVRSERSLGGVVCSGEGETRLVDVGVQLIDHRGHCGGRLVLPQGVLEPEESGPARVVHALGEAVRAPVDLVVEVPEGVIGRPQAGVVEVGDQPGLLGLVHLPGVDQRLQMVGVGGQDGEPGGYLGSGRW